MDACGDASVEANREFEGKQGVHRHGAERGMQVRGGESQNDWNYKFQISTTRPGTMVRTNKKRVKGVG